MKRIVWSLGRNRCWAAAWAIALMTPWHPGCGSGEGSLSTMPKTPLRVDVGSETKTPIRIAAASDLQAVLPKLVDRFKTMSGIAAKPVFQASGQLAQQIRQGAPYDVFLAANESFVRDLADEGLILPDSVQAYARGSLVLAVYQEVGEKVRSLNDLTRPEVKKIAIANPTTAPYGKAGKQALERAGLWTKVEPKIVIADSVRLALLYAQKGDVEAALIGRAIASVPEIRTINIDSSLYDPIVQALGIVSGTKQPDDAKALARFVLGAEGQAILKDFGFKPIPMVAGASGDGLPGRGEEAKKID